MYAPGSVFCNSYSPYEKQFALKFSKRLISSLLVTKMGLRRLGYYAKDAHTPFNDFKAEYYFNLMQEEERLVQTSYPNRLYAKKDDPWQLPNKEYRNKITMVKDSGELDMMLKHNDVVFNSKWPVGDPPPLIYTPLLMSIEGGQVLYGPISGSEKNILDPLDDEGDSNLVHNELLSNVDSLMNLPHRLFFITLGHFAQNHVVGYAKTLDRDPENFQHRVMSMLTKLSKLRNNIIKKTYAGFNPIDTIGLKIVTKFLNPATSRVHKKPTYIDVKHMDIKARIQYYYRRRELEKELKIKIPIVASHFAVSGEKQAMAAATGLWPNFDRYGEVENTGKFYRERILREKKGNRDSFWIKGVMRGEYFRGDNKLDTFEIAMYKSLNFCAPDSIKGKTFDPFAEYDINKDDNVGWFYPWSINLFDEEIIEINKSDGIIGLLLDPRQLGTFAPKYKDSIKVFENNFLKEKRKFTNEELAFLNLDTNDLVAKEYLKCEPLLRNIFYIVRLISQQKDAENHYRKNDTTYLKENYPWFIKDDSTLKKDPWELIALGSDYDGLIDPIDAAPTSSYIPLLHRRLVVYAYIFAKIHIGQFHCTDDRNKRLINNLQDSYDKMKKIFYENGKDFIIKYF
jgi:hypothetical protein